MKRYRGGATVEPGLYFNLRQLSFRSVDEAGALPGGGGDVYRRVPVLLLLLVGPVLGLAYIVFLPFVGFVMVGWLLGVKASHLAASAARAAMRVLRPGWEPSLAFLSRSRPVKPEAKETDEWARSVRERLEAPDRDERA